MVLEHERVADLFGAHSQQARGDFAVAFVIGIFETRFLLRMSRLLDRHMWGVDQLTMIRNFAEYDFMLPGWRKYEAEYYPPFREFINADIIPKAEQLRAEKHAQATSSLPSPV